MTELEEDAYRNRIDSLAEVAERLEEKEREDRVKDQAAKFRIKELTTTYNAQVKVLTTDRNLPI